MLDCVGTPSEVKIILCFASNWAHDIAREAYLCSRLINCLCLQLLLLLLHSMQAVQVPFVVQLLVGPHLLCEEARHPNLPAGKACSAQCSAAVWHTLSMHWPS